MVKKMSLVRIYRHDFDGEYQEDGVDIVARRYSDTCRVLGHSWELVNPGNEIEVFGCTRCGMTKTW